VLAQAVRLLALLLGGAVLALAGPAPTATAAPPLPRGIYAVLNWDEAPAPATWDNPLVDGVVVRTYWSSLQPRRHAYDWSYLDAMLADAQAHGKGVHLIVACGFYSPSWVLGDPAVETALFRVPHGPHNISAAQPLPLPWNGAYLGYWFAFVDRLAARYGRHSALRYVSITGPDSHNGEVSLPRTREDRQHWLQLVGGDTALLERLLAGAWRAATDRFCADFPERHATLAVIRQSLPVAAGPTVQNRYRSRLARYGATSCPATFGLQNNGLDGHTGDTPQWALVGEYAGRILTGFQTRASANLFGRLCPGPDLVQCRQEIFRQALLVNGLSHHPDFLEVMEAEANDPDLAAILVEARAALVP